MRGDAGRKQSKATIVQLHARSNGCMHLEPTLPGRLAAGKALAMDDPTREKIGKILFHSEKMEKKRMKDSVGIL
jgi:hypothetical protein